MCLCLFPGLVCSEEVDRHIAVQLLQMSMEESRVSLTGERVMGWISLESGAYIFGASV